MSKTMMDAHDLAVAESFLAAEARIAAGFESIEEAIAPELRRMRATGRITYVTDPQRGAIWGHAFLRPPYAPSAEAEWFLGWGIRFPDGGSGWEGAQPPLPRSPYAVVAVGGNDAARPLAVAGRQALAPPGWSSIAGEAAFLAACIDLRELPAATDVSALAEWVRARIIEIAAVLPRLAEG